MALILSLLPSQVESVFALMPKSLATSHFFLSYKILHLPIASINHLSGSSNTKQLRYERSISPPRSSNSSGYGTGSSRKSFNEQPTHQQRFPGNNVVQNGVLASSMNNNPNVAAIHQPPVDQISSSSGTKWNHLF